MATFLLARMLTLAAWEADLGGAQGDPLDGNELHLNFASVEFADFGALARALLLLDAAVRRGVPAKVTLPVTTLTAIEEGRVHQYRAEDVQRDLVRRARSRGDTLTFMGHVGFIDAIRGANWPEGAVQLVRDVDAELRDESGPAHVPVAGPRDAPYRSQRLLPFQWLRPMRGARLREAESFATGLEELGLSRADARALSQTVLAELMENAFEQGDDDRPFVLVGAILLPADTYALRQPGIQERLRRLADCAMADDSRVLRMIFADSEADLIGRLTPADPDASTDDVILRAFEKWPVDDSIRSLWRVNRMVRSYRGSVLVRTGDTLAGYVYAATTEGFAVTEHGLGHLPGALFELTVLAGRGAPPPSIEWGEHPAEDMGRIHWVECTFDPDSGLADTDRRQLEREAHRAQEEPGLVRVGVLVPVLDAAGHLSRVTMRQAMSAVLVTTGRIASPTVVVVVFPDADPHVVELCVAGFNEALAASEVTGSASPPGPIMVLGGYGDTHWYGGTGALRETLTAMVAAGGTMKFTDAVRCWQGAGGNPMEFRPVLGNQEQLLTLHENRLTLRLSPGTVYRSLAESVQRELTEAIEQGGPGVRVGRFRGPALRVTNRSIDVHTLVKGTVGTPRAAYALARKVEAALRPLSGRVRPTAIVQVASANPVLVRQVSECLAIGGRAYPTPSEFEIGDLPVGERVPLGAVVVLSTDLISTENSVRRAAAAIAGAGAEPLIIACVLDARQTRGPVRLLNNTIPVVSLAEVAIDSDQDDETPIIDLDPLLLSPQEPMPGPSTTIPEHEFLRWCAKIPGALRLGHIDWPPNRHFSAFIRVDTLLRDRKTRDKITGAVLATATRAFVELDVALPGEPGVPWDIWFVESRDEDARRLSMAVHAKLAARDAPVVAPTPVRRAVAGNTWAFPTSLGEKDRHRPIIIIGWAANTASTMLNLTRLAASKGATAVVAVSMMSQLDASDAEVMGMLRAVARPDGHQIPVAVTFVTVSSITALMSHDCAMCATRERYRVEEEETPEPLHAHATRLREMVRIRGREEVSHDAAKDLFTVPVNNENVVDYLRWRGLLIRALRDLGARQEVIDRLETLASGHATSVWSSPGLIRLLAAEQQWLKLPPLRFAVARNLLFNICVTGLEEAVTAPVWLRLQSLMVLSVTVPDRLAELLPRILPGLADEPVLVNQLFLDCYRLLRRPPLDSPLDIQRLRQSLSEVREFLEKSDPSNAHHRYVVSELINFVKDRKRPPPKSPQEAWDYLREELVRPVTRHRLEAALLRVRGFVEDLTEAAPSPNSIKNALEDWERCSRQIEQRALVYLPALRGILGGVYVRDWFGRREQQRLLKAIQADDKALVGVNDRLNQLAHGTWQPGEPQWQETRKKLLNRLNWWNHTFLAAHVRGSEAPAMIVQLVDSAPTELIPAVESILEANCREPVVHRIDSGSIRVFCPRELLEDLIKHLLENVGRHRLPAEPCRIEVSYRQTAETVQFIMCNSGTHPSHRTGNGLMAFNDKLQPFEGTVTHRIPSDAEWTFAVTVTLPVWRGA
jgi:hypothetical protein